MTPGSFPTLSMPAATSSTSPSSKKMLMAVLRWIVEDFQPGRLYPEADVNRVVSRRHPDFATIRRRLVDEDLMQRQRSVYWRTGTVTNVGHDPESWPLTTG